MMGWLLGRLGRKATAKRMYAAAQQSRLTADWYSANSSEDYELSVSLRILRQRSRALVRDSAYAKRARTVIVSNIIGSGIGLQAGVISTRGRLNDRINDDIEQTWTEWCLAENCHMGGRLHFYDIERMLVAQLFEAGEVFIRKHFAPVGDSAVPLALEIIEAERIADENETPKTSPGFTTRLGIESDPYGRPVAYWVRATHPGEIRRDLAREGQIFRVPAREMIHLCLLDRWPQTRGVPWLHAGARRLRDMDGYAEAEIVAARMSAAYMGFIKSPDTPIADSESDGVQEREFRAGTIEHLAPGEDFIGWSPNRPNTAMDPFMRLMLREVAAGVGVSYESLSRDYSQTNYSSSRQALLEDRDLWRTLQQWFIRAFRAPLHKDWLDAAMLAGAIRTVPIETYLRDPGRYQAVSFKPRGWSWVDPTREVQAYRDAVGANMMTLSDVIAATGNGSDLEDVLTGRRRELDLMEELGLKDGAEKSSPEPADESVDTESESEIEDNGGPARVLNLRRRSG
jgi:lambda family phage portal protein